MDHRPPGPRPFRARSRMRFCVRFCVRVVLALPGLLLACVGTLARVFGAVPSTLSAQERGNPPGEWRYWGGDAWTTRYSPLEQINAENFGQLRVAWVWRGD